MALTAIQREICRLIARDRIEGGDAYVAGGAALNTVLASARVSRAVDLFHDTEEALRTTWDADRTLLIDTGFSLEVLRERPGFVEAVARNREESVILQWARDSAFRFFPLVTHTELGLTLHPFDLATNKVLALAGRVEVRDWIDTLACSDAIQHLGYLAWAACGKDPGYSPLGILSVAARTARYSKVEVDELAFDGPPPDAAELSRRWHTMLAEGRELVHGLPADRAGYALLTEQGELYRGDRAALGPDLEQGAVRFHAGTIRGVYPSIRPQEQGTA